MKKSVLAAIFCHFPSVCLMDDSEDDKVVQKVWKAKGEKENIGLCIQTNPRPQDTARVQLRLWR